MTMDRPRGMVTSAPTSAAARLPPSMRAQIHTAAGSSANVDATSANWVWSGGRSRIALPAARWEMTPRRAPPASSAAQALDPTRSVTIAPGAGLSAREWSVSQ